MIGNALALSLAVPLVSPAHASPQEGEPPPGLVLIQGGKTKMGATVKEVEPLILKNEQIANTLAGETPQHEVKVDDFYLMVTEVTNEQYAEYVSATGAQPPYLWGDEALEAGRVAFMAEQGRLMAEARERKEPFDRKKFDAAAWWEENWQESDWKVPEGDEDRPVVYVSYADAQGYARWAGLRLMTEQEYTRAARGDSDRAFPWGEDWDPAACNSLEYKQHDDTMKVGSFEKGAVNGVHDLVGNVWEWTSSKYTPFEKYKMLSIKMGKGRGARVLDAMAGFDPNQRVAVSGSFAQTRDGVRITTRNGADRTQRTEAFGFRCAASVQPGQDAANWVADEDIDFSKVPGDLVLFPGGTVVLSRWQHRSGTSQVPDYAVITGYERTLFCPVESLPASSKSELAKNTLEAPLVLGVLSLDHTTMSPELSAGSYLVAWRAEGKLKAVEKADEGQDAQQALSVGGQDDSEPTPFWEAPGFDPEQDCMFLLTLTGEPIIAFPSGKADVKKLKGLGSWRLEKFVPPEEEPEEGAPPVVPMDTLLFSLAIPGKRSQGVFLELPIKIAPGTIDESWK